jgi:low temperature requirement protein LtrA
VFVAAGAQVGTPLLTDYSFAGLGRSIVLLLVIWWAWSGHAIDATRFDPDDGVQRVLTLMQMVAVIFMAANAEQGLDSGTGASHPAWTLRQTVID